MLTAIYSCSDNVECKASETNQTIVPMTAQRVSTAAHRFMISPGGEGRDPGVGVDHQEKIIGGLSGE